MKGEVTGVFIGNTYAGRTGPMSSSIKHVWCLFLANYLVAISKLRRQPCIRCIFIHLEFVSTVDLRFQKLKATCLGRLILCSGM